MHGVLQDVKIPVREDNPIQKSGNRTRITQYLCLTAIVAV